MDPHRRRELVDLEPMREALALDEEQCVQAAHLLGGGIGPRRERRAARLAERHQVEAEFVVGDRDGESRFQLSSA